MSRMLPMFMVVCLGVICLFGFFAVLGLFSPDDVLWLSLGVAALAIGVLAHSLWVRHAMDTHGNRDLFRSVNHLRERRGF
jgi:hypothetical protein